MRMARICMLTIPMLCWSAPRETPPVIGNACLDFLLVGGTRRNPQSRGTRMLQRVGDGFEHDALDVKHGCRLEGFHATAFMQMGYWSSGTSSESEKII